MSKRSREISNKVIKAVMVVEPDVLVRMTIADYLRECGYRVVEAITGRGGAHSAPASRSTRSCPRSSCRAPSTASPWRSESAKVGGVEVILTTGYAMTAKKAGELCEQGRGKRPYHPDLIVERLKILFEKHGQVPLIFGNNFRFDSWSVRRRRVCMGVAADQVAGEERRTILLVEDDALLRVSAADHLRGKGYHVIEAGTVIEAATILSSGPSVHLVFSDVDLPGATGGLSLAVWINAYHPKVPVVHVGHPGGHADAHRSAPESVHSEALRLREGRRPDRRGDRRGVSHRDKADRTPSVSFLSLNGPKHHYNSDMAADLRSNSRC